MLIYNEIIKKLLNKQASESNTYLVTVYYPSGNFTKRQLKQRLRSLILAEFRSHQDLKKFKRLRQLIAERIEKELDLLPRLEKGIGVFVELTARPTSKKTIPDPKVKVISLLRTPDQEIYIGKSFDLDQLVWINNVPIAGLVLQLKRKNCDFYMVEGKQMKFLTKKENRFIGAEEKEYSQEFKPISPVEVHHGSGEDKVGRRELAQNSYFLKDLTNFIKKLEVLKSGCDCMLIYYSSSFTELIEDLVQEITGVVNFKLLLENKIVKDLKDTEKLNRAALKKIKKFARDTEQELLEQARDSKLYIENWEQVCQAAQRKRIETLFIKPTARREGYINSDQTPFIRPSEESRSVNNIAPWIVRTVLGSGGKLVVMRKLEEDLKISAKLRY